MNKSIYGNLSRYFKKFSFKISKSCSLDFYQIRICCCHCFNSQTFYPTKQFSHLLSSDRIVITSLMNTRNIYNDGYFPCKSFPYTPTVTQQLHLRYSTNESAKPKEKEILDHKNKSKPLGDETKIDESSLFKKLIQNRVLTVPNILTTIRIVLTPFLCYLVLTQSYNMALSIFVFAGFTDLLDGLIARTFENQISDLGSFLDPLADKLLVSTLFLSLSYVSLIPIYLVLIVITRDALLTGSGIYIRYITLTPRPKSLKEFFDPTNRSVKLQPTMMSKVNTAVQLTLVAVTLASPVFNFIDHPYIHALWYLTAGTTIASGIGYIFAKDTFKFVEKTYRKK